MIEIGKDVLITVQEGVKLLGSVVDRVTDEQGNVTYTIYINQITNGESVCQPTISGVIEELLELN